MALAYTYRAEVEEHTKKFIKVPKKKNQEKSCSTRGKLSNVIVEMITRHFRLRKHLHTLRIASEPDCRKCCMEEETAHNVRMPRNQIHQGKAV